VTVCACALAANTAENTTTSTANRHVRRVPMLNSSGLGSVRLARGQDFAVRGKAGSSPDAYVRARPLYHRAWPTSCLSRETTSPRQGSKRDVAT
jgi:hypothetical protein